MIRSALLLSAGILVATALSCAPAVAPPPPPPAFIAAWPLASCDADSFANAVQTVGPIPLTPTATPAPTGPVPANSTMWQDLRAAFALAPPFLRARLCRLDGVFISQNSDSWGFRNYYTGAHYVAVTKDLWNGNAHAMPYQSFENRTLRQLLRGWTGPHHPAGGPDPNDPARTVLAALAHEYGHTLFYDTFVPVRGGPANWDPNFDQFCNDGRGNFFTSAAGTWDPNITDEPPANRWRGLGDIASLHRTGDVQIRQIVDAVPAPGMPDTKDAGRKLARIYDPSSTLPPQGRWAGLFAAFSPQEDFVETFKLFVLRKAAAPLQSLPITIPIAGGPQFSADIPATCPARPALRRKLSCFQHALCGDKLADPCGTTCTP